MLIKGWANKPNLSDHKYILMPFSFRDDIPRFLKHQRLYKNHQKSSGIVGKILKLEARPEGLWVECEIFCPITKAQIMSGDLTAFSVDVTYVDVRESDGVKYAHKVKFFELSVCRGCRAPGSIIEEVVLSPRTETVRA